MQPPAVLPSSIVVPDFILRSSSYLWYYCQNAVNAIPGSSYVVDYVKRSHQQDPYRTIVEVFLIIYGIIYFLRNPRKQGVQEGPKMSTKEVDALLDEWQPEPLAQDASTVEWRTKKIPVVLNSSSGSHVDVVRNDGAERYSDVLNCASNNFLQLSCEPSVIKIAKDTIQNYGVGACGPAGFYGNQDVHNHLEYDLARFFGTENAVLYGQDFCIAASVIPAFTKRGDVIVADNKCSVSLQNALQLSRSTVYYFDHNDTEALEELLQQLQERDLKEKLPALPRKFIITEGLFHNSGDIPPLPKLVELKRKYKYRLLVDETFSLGVLGATGRGITEYFNMPRQESVDITIGSMATALGSSGGFVLGDNSMSLHQRIGSHAYTFSASLPAFTVTTASEVLRRLDEDNSIVQRLRLLSNQMHEFFSQDKELQPLIEVTSDKDSCVLHFRLTEDMRFKKFHYTEESLFEEISAMHTKYLTNKHIESYESEEKFLQQIVDYALKEYNVLISRNTFVLKHETLPVTPSLKVCCGAQMADQDLFRACDGVKTAILSVVNTTQETA
ncbi:LANO_0C08900g1_1 [Lachancea nothofagi CBS 11611]|uniref:serine C-palmitoyltransferase n=1 Tax=Lachancea nothofagi CBS 11611 TaxID=1266666 RepID=A0A1G4J9N0_9SACH|nr:LANO_0C08900g1_1 [Lachancea nothofagi CBS 11611]